VIRTGLAIVLLGVPLVASVYTDFRLSRYKKEPTKSLGPLESFRPDKYALEGYPWLYAHWLSMVVLFASAALVVGVLHP
jgi:hypothetical protein